MSRYHRLPAHQKRAESLASMREPAIACPSCDTMTTPRDLITHVKERCPGQRDPGPGAAWVSWREARSLGVPSATLVRWIERGHVRIRGDRQDRRYLLRDVALRMAWRAADRRR